MCTGVNAIDGTCQDAVAQSIEVPAVPLRCANNVKEVAVNVFRGRPCAVKREFFASKIPLKEAGFSQRQPDQFQ
jgi:hypothetical protein